MLFDASKVVKGLFTTTKYPEEELKENAIYQISVNKKDGTPTGISLRIFIVSVCKYKEGHTIAWGHFLDETQWYRANLFLYNEGSSKNTITLSPSTTPLLSNKALVEYYKEVTDEIPDLTENLVPV